MEQQENINDILNINNNEICSLNNININHNSNSSSFASF